VQRGCACRKRAHTRINFVALFSWTSTLPARVCAGALVVDRHCQSLGYVARDSGVGAPIPTQRRHFVLIRLCLDLEYADPLHCALQCLRGSPEIIVRLHIDPGFRTGAQPLTEPHRHFSAYSGSAIECTRQRDTRHAERRCGIGVTETKRSAKTPSLRTSPGCGGLCILVTLNS
jgi:hypothetical protein